MKGSKYIYFLFLLIFLLVFLLLVEYVNSLHKVEESFTPKIREMYRPVIRKTRIIGEGFYNKSSSNISNLFRKFQIM